MNRREPVNVPEGPGWSMWLKCWKLYKHVEEMLAAMDLERSAAEANATNHLTANERQPEDQMGNNAKKREQAERFNAAREKAKSIPGDDQIVHRLDVYCYKSGRMTIAGMPTDARVGMQLVSNIMKSANEMYVQLAVGGVIDRDGKPVEKPKIQVVGAGALNGLPPAPVEKVN